MYGYSKIVLLFVSAVLAVHGADYEYDPNDYDYSYGDLSVQYDDGPNRLKAGEDKLSPLVSSVTHFSQATNTPLPLCCPKGTVYDQASCVEPSSGSGFWKPVITSLPNAVFHYSKGFPQCHQGASREEFHASDIFFDNTSLYLPSYVRHGSIPDTKYCIVAVDETIPSCQSFRTKVFTCIGGTAVAPSELPGMWLCIAVAHLLLVLCLLAFFLVPSLRSLQGHYMICLVISLLVYNVTLYPLSTLVLNIGDISCIALRAVKYFFFCTTFLWFNVICFDVWRTLRSAKDVSGRRRFVLYSVYTWVLGAALTVAVLVIRIMAGASATDSADPLVCEIELPVHVVLQMGQAFTLIANVIMISIASYHFCHYEDKVASLSRSDASKCLTRAIKLLVIMLCHAVMCATDFFQIKFISLWQFVTLEAVAIFGVFVYRNFVLNILKRKLMKRCLCCCASRLPYADRGHHSNSSQMAALNGHGGGFAEAGPLPTKQGITSAV